MKVYPRLSQRRIPYTEIPSNVFDRFIAEFNGHVPDGETDPRPFCWRHGLMAHGADSWQVMTTEDRAANRKFLDLMHPITNPHLKNESIADL